MKKFLTSIIVLFSFSFVPVFAREFEITSQNVILYNMNESSVIYQENEEEKVSIASLTKIMTAIVAIENTLDLDAEVLITAKDFIGTVGYSEAGFKTGDKVTITDLLYGILLPSGADAVNAVVRVTSRSEEEFVLLMNAKAQEIGLKNTHFANPVGKDDENNYSTAKDVALLLQYALKNEVFKTIFTTKYYKVPSNGLELKSTLSHYNMFDTSSILGSKSGFTKNAGRCLASISHLNGVDYLLVVIKSDLTQNFNAVKDTLTIYDYYNSNYSYQKILSKNKTIETLPVSLGKVKTYEIKVPRDVSLYLKNDTYQDLVYQYEGVEKITKSMKQGEKLGQVRVLYENNVIYTTDVLLNERLKFYHPGLYIFLIFLFFAFLLLFKNYLQKRKRKNRKKTNVGNF